VTRGTFGSTDNEQFNSNSAQINFTQPIWRRAEMIASTQADLVVEQNRMQVIAAEQDLFVRFLRAWFDVMLARDTVDFTSNRPRRRDNSAIRHACGGAGLASQPELEGALARYEKAMRSMWGPKPRKG